MEGSSSVPAMPTVFGVSTPPVPPTVSSLSAKILTSLAVLTQGPDPAASAAGPSVLLLVWRWFRSAIPPLGLSEPPCATVLLPSLIV